MLEVNMKCPARNTTVQLSAPYSNPERHNTLSGRQTDRQTDSLNQPIVSRYDDSRRSYLRAARNL